VSDPTEWSYYLSDVSVDGGSIMPSNHSQPYMVFDLANPYIMMSSDIYDNGFVQMI